MSVSAEPIRVLHVDDEPAFAELAADCLERESDVLTVDSATSASSAIEDLEATAIDCIVSDYDMPEMTGLEFLELVREQHPRLPFILFTGKGSEEIASEAISIGVTDYLQKRGGTEQYELLGNRIENAVKRYRTEQQLGQTRERFQRIFEQSHDAIMILDPRNGEIRNANSRSCELLGYEREELLSLSPEEIHPHEVGKFRQFVDSVYLNETGWTEELSCLTKTGTKIPMHLSASTIHLDGRPHMLAIIRPRPEQSGERSSQKLMRTLLDHATDEIYAIDPDTGDFLDVNATACQNLGYERAELLDRSVQDIAAAGNVDDWDDHIARLLEQGWVSEELAHQRRDGTTYAVSIQAKHVVAEEGRTYLIAVARPTDRASTTSKTADLHDATRDLMGAESPEEIADIAVETAKVVLDKPLNAVWLSNSDEARLEPVAATEQARDLLEEIPNFEPDESLSWEAFESGEIMRFDDVSTVPGRLSEATPVRSEIILPLGTHGVMNVGSTKRGAFDEAEVSTTRMLAANTEAALTRAAREQELRRQNERLEAFTSVVSHDLRNPLNVATSRLELAAQECDSPHLADIAHAHDRMADIIENLLALTRQDGRPAETEAIDLEILAQDCWQTVETGDASLSVEVDGQINANPSRLQQLLENLVRNSVEHGGDDVTVTIGATDDGFYFADDGAGLQQVDQEQLFEAGYSTADEGTGLGLAIVRQVVDEHGWEIDVTDSTAGGVRFEITGVAVGE